MKNSTPLVRATPHWFILYFCLVLASACARAPIKAADQAMRPAKVAPVLGDDLEFSPLVTALSENIKGLRAKPDSVMRFGPREIAKVEYIKALEALLVQAKADATGQSFKKFLETNFVPYEVYGRKDWSEIFMTSYFEPVIEGSLKRTDGFSQSLFTTPNDLVEIDLNSLVATRPKITALKDLQYEQRSQSGMIRGRLTSALASGRTLARVDAYPPRAEIDSEGAMKNRAQTLAWVDPIDGFMLEVQGSGVVRFADGSQMNVGYASQNGHPYVSIGSFLFDQIPREKMSLQTIEAYLRKVGPVEARRIMNLNPSHVFFQKLSSAGRTFFGNEVVAGRTVATDSAYFPKGTLAFLEFEKPIFDSEAATEPTSWQRTSRYVLDQDTGGAIRGADRLDLFWGRGAAAKQAAGVMKRGAKLWYFVPREEFLKSLL